MQTCVPGFWEYILGLLVLSSATIAGGEYLLTAPSIYTAFTEELVVGYSVPPNVTLPSAFVALLYTAEGQRDREITRLRVIPGRNSDEQPVACGVVEYAGTYVLRMYMFADGPLLAEKTFTVVWPKIQLTLPQQRNALSTNAGLKIQSQASCEPKIRRESFYIELYFKRRAAFNRDLPLDTSESISKENYTHISIPDQSKTFQCQLFDLDGAYQAVLMSTFNSGTLISRSNVLNVTWGSYSVDIHRTSIFPCTSAIKVYYTRPACSKTVKYMQDRIRMFELRTSSNGSLAAPLRQRYVTERHVDPDKMSFSLGCRLFNKTASGYCFKYYSISRQGAVVMQKQICLPLQPDAVLYLDGGWGVWSEWTDCTVTCGSGKMNRFRTCTNPVPLHGGRFCEGEPVEWKDCHRDCPGYIPDSPLKSIKIDVKCACGCDMTSDQGEIIASGRCQGTATWNIEVDESHSVELTFTYFKIMQSRQSVEIRDGLNSESDLLYSSTGGGEPAQHITSSSNKMMLTLVTSHADPSAVQVFSQNATLLIHLHGFIASYRIVAGGNPSASTIIRRHESSIMDSKVAIVGISLCVLIVLVVIAFVVFHRLYHKRHKYGMAASESPAHIARSTSMHSSRCSSPPPGITNVDVEAPLTGEVSKKESIVSRGSSISSTCSAGFKKLRSKAESVTGSPKPSTKHYSPLPSPYTANSPPEEFLHTANFFKASPNLRNCRPRSPKIHPSPKFKHSPVTPSSPSQTKHELLIKKRKEQLGPDSERIVTGSSGSSKDAPIALAETPTPQENKSVIPVKDSLSVAKTPVNERTPQNEVIILESLREEMKLNGEDQHQDSDQETTSFIQPSVKARRPTSLTDSYSSESIGAKPKLRTDKDSKKTKKKPSAMEERQKLLPKPDGQSPKSPTREEHSKASTPRSTKSSRSSKSAKTMSPTRSIHTPSEIGSVDIELEYDDFIDDDPLSYFDVEELQKLKWSGGERIGKPIKE